MVAQIWNMELRSQDKMLNADSTQPAPDSTLTNPHSQAGSRTWAECGNEVSFTPETVSLLP